MNEDRVLCEPLYIYDFSSILCLIFVLFKGILLNIKMYMAMFLSVHFGKFSHQKKIITNVYAI